MCSKTNTRVLKTVYFDNEKCKVLTLKIIKLNKRYATGILLYYRISRALPVESVHVYLE